MDIPQALQQLSGKEIDFRCQQCTAIVKHCLKVSRTASGKEKAVASDIFDNSLEINDIGLPLHSVEEVDLLCYLLKQSICVLD